MYLVEAKASPFMPGRRSRPVSLMRSSRLRPCVSGAETRQYNFESNASVSIRDAGGDTIERAGTAGLVGGDVRYWNSGVFAVEWACALCANDLGIMGAVDVA